MRSASLLLLVGAKVVPPVAVEQRGAAAAFVERVEKAADGSLDIILSDRTRVAAPKEEDWHKADGPTSYEEPAIASDRQTVGWLVYFKNDTTSYDILPVPDDLPVRQTDSLDR